MSERHVVGQPVPRIDAVDKVTGRARYTGDLHLPGLLVGAFLRSPHAHARIVRIDTSAAKRLPGVFAVVTQADLSADQAQVTEEGAHGTRRVEPPFADGKVRYQGEKIAAVAALTKEIAEEALRLIEVEYEVLPAVVDPLEAIKPEAPRIHDDVAPVAGPDGQPLNNIAGEMHRAEGDVEAGFRQADHVFEDTYVVHRVHQTYLEPQISIADVAPDGRVTIWTSTQAPFDVRSNVARSLGIPLRKINVVGMTMGGGFGGKFGGLTDTYAVLLAQRAHRPVKVAYDREDELLDGRPAPGAVITIKTGVRKDGRIVARQALAFWNAGVGSGGQGGTWRIRGVYDIPNVKVDAYAVHTNEPAPGAYRAPSAPQATFASEAQLNRIARELGLDPVELRLRNLREGDELGFKETLRAAARTAGWSERERGPNEGWGVAIGEWTNGSGPAGVVVSIHEDGSVRVFYGMMDISGTDTSMAQIAAEVLGVPYSAVTTVRGDTDSAPFATGSGGSVTTFSFGNAVKRAAEDARRRVLELAAEHLEMPVESLELTDQRVVARDRPELSVTLAELGELSLRTIGGPIVGRGAFAEEPSATTISAQVARVRVDPETGQVKVLKLVIAQDVGKAINPLSVEGQLAGGAMQALSWGLMEQLQYGPDGRMLNPSFLDYRIPTALDAPEIETVIVEVPTRHGPFGVKGVGEPPITPTIAAIASAVADATGVWVREAPLTPERVYRALREARG